MNYDIVNDACLMRCMDYSDDVELAEASFRAEKDKRDINDTLIIGCPYSECEIAHELYIKDVRGARIVRNGLFGKTCFLNTGQQGSNPVE